MAKQTIAIGTTPNDGTGDPLRDAFSKVNDNFDEVYSSLTFASNNATIANTVIIGNSTINTIANSTNIKLSNSAVSTTITNQFVHIGNTTVNATANQTSISFANSISNSSLTSRQLTIGNTTVNNALITVDSISIRSNTFSVGSSSNTANGYTYLTNGIKLNWGWVSANSSTGNATFSSAYTVNAFIITATSNTVDISPAIIAQNNTVVAIRTSNSSLVNVYWMAIGY